MVNKEEKSDFQRSEERFQAFMENSWETIYCVEMEQPVDISLPVNDQLDLIY